MDRFSEIMQRLSIHIAFLDHLVEMFERSRGRCAHQFKRCGHFDDSFAWISDVLRDTTWPEERWHGVRRVGPRRKGASGRTEPMHPNIEYPWFLYLKSY